MCIIAIFAAIQSANFKYGAAEEFGKLQELQPGVPNLAMEFWTGWFDHWGEPWHNTHDPEGIDLYVFNENLRPCIESFDNQIKGKLR